jgi:serine/threonine-protein kinase
LNQVPKTPNLIGTTVEDRFEVLSLIGEGGVAFVYKARLADHAKVAGQGERFVAIKVLKRHEQFSLTDIERLKREGRALQRLRHPNIVKAYSFGFLKTSEPYLVLDFLSGKSLEDYIYKSDLFSLSWTLNTFVQICRGLACAHENGLIHRDLKPSNVMILDAECDGATVKLLDFGTAKFTVSQPDELQLTKKGIIFGSPLYISPEQISGKTFDKRADIYSLGCLMYEALSGQVPHKGKNEMDTLMKHMHEQPKTFRELKIARDIPVEVENIVVQCMKKEPEERIQNVLEVEERLTASLKKL